MLYIYVTKERYLLRKRKKRQQKRSKLGQMSWNPIKYHGGGSYGDSTGDVRKVKYW